MSSYASYLKAALLSQINLVVLAGLGMISLVSMNPLPILLGLGGEVAWLGVAPMLPAYRKRVDNRQKRNKQLDTEDEADRMLSLLPEKEQNRYRKLSQLAGGIRSNYESIDENSRKLLQPVMKKLDELLPRYLRMLQARNTYGKHLLENNAEEVSGRIRALEAEIESDEDRVAELKLKQKAILEQRVAKLEKANQDAALLDVQLSTVEELVRLLKEQSITMKEPQRLTGSVDEIMSEIEATEATVSELSTSFDVLFDRALEEAEEQKEAGRRSIK